MNLTDYELIPGKVVEVDDPEKLGRIKASLPGYENTTIMKVESMPWIYPFTIGRYQGFSKMLVNSSVWVLRNKKNDYELWYLPLFELNPNTKSIVNSYDDTEVLLSRSLGDKNAFIYYSDSKGINLSIGENHVNISGDGAITIGDSEGAKITVNGGNIYLNTTESDESPAKASVVENALNGLINGLENLCSAAHSCCYTIGLEPALQKLKADLNESISSNKLHTPSVYI